MAVVTGRLEVESRGENDVVDLTGGVRRVVGKSGVKSGVVTVFVSGSTAAVTTLEFEPGLVKDFPEMLERVSPKGREYEHQKTWNDGNGHSHVKAALVGPSLTIPVVNGDIAVGTWQQVVLVELDIRPRRRKIVVQVVGE